MKAKQEAVICVVLRTILKEIDEQCPSMAELAWIDWIAEKYIALPIEKSTRYTKFRAHTYNCNCCQSRLKQYQDIKDNISAINHNHGASFILDIYPEIAKNSMKSICEESSC